MHVIAGKAVCLREAAQPEFRAYAENVVKTQRRWQKRCWHMASIS